MPDISIAALMGQTPASLMTQMKTVDGAGSGLDSDSLDGIDSSGFALAGHTHAASLTAMLDTPYANLPTGLSQSNGGTGNGLPVNFAAVFTINTGDNRVAQMAMGSMSDEFYWRGHRTANAGWQTWRRLWHDGNLVIANYAPLASPALTGTPVAPTATAGTSTNQIATTQFVATAVSNVPTTIGDATLTIAKTIGLQTALDGKAVLNSSPTFTGSVIVQGGAVTSQAANGTANAHFWMKDDTGVSQGLLYWERTTDVVRLRRYNAAGTAAEGELQLEATDVKWNGNIVYHAGNFDPSSKLNVAGGSVGSLGVSSGTGKQLSVGNWAQLSSGGNGNLVLGNNAYYQNGDNTYRYAQTHASLGASGIVMTGFNSGTGPYWFDMGDIATTADATFTPTLNQIWHAGLSTVVADNQTLQLAGTTGNLNFGSAGVRQMINLWGTAYGVGIQNNTFYLRSGATSGGYAWFQGGTHSTTQNDPGAGGVVLMKLSSAGLLNGMDVLASSTVSVTSGGRIFVGFDAGQANSISCSNWFRTSGNTGWYNQDWAGGWYMTDATYVRSYTNKAVVASDFVLSSDKRLKTDIRPFEFRGRLKPVNFTFIEDGKKEIGFLAQDVKRLYPEIVGSLIKDGGFMDGKRILQLSLQKTAPILSFQVNRAEDNIVKLEKTNGKLVKENAKLKTEVKSLSQRLARLEKTVAKLAA